MSSLVVLSTSKLFSLKSVVRNNRCSAELEETRLAACKDTHRLSLIFLQNTTWLVMWLWSCDYICSTTCGATQLHALRKHTKRTRLTKRQTCRLPRRAVWNQHGLPQAHFNYNLAALHTDTRTLPYTLLTRCVTLYLTPCMNINAADA